MGDLDVTVERGPGRRLVLLHGFTQGPGSWDALLAALGPGYEIVRVETVRTTRVVYYRRGNMGRGKGKGPIERIVIRPEPDRVVFVSPPPRGLMVDINVRLGM